MFRSTHAVAVGDVTNIDPPCESWDMTNTEPEPIRLDQSSPAKRRPLPITRKIPLPNPSPIPTSFRLALAERRSTEQFVRIPLNDLATWLYYCASVQSVHSDDPNRQQRFVASFGGLHPAHVVLGDPNGKWSTYLSEEHALGELVVDPDAASQVWNKAMQLFSAPEATLVTLISDRDLVANYYENASGLMLRDAGVLLGHSALVAAGLGLGFRILGSSGSSSLESIVYNLPFRPMATGLAWVGGKEQLT
jgi:hypothetical protein